MACALPPARSTACVTWGSCTGNAGSSPQPLANPVPSAGTAAALGAEVSQPEKMFMQDDLLMAVPSTAVKPPLAHHISVLSPVLTPSHKHNLLAGGVWAALQAHGRHKSGALCATLEKMQLFSLPLHEVLCLCLVGLEESGPCVLFRA